MIQKFYTTLYTPLMAFWQEACMGLEGKSAHELRDAFQFLVIWRDHFEAAFGELHAISHLSNPNDPPDVIAHFANGDVPIEITSIEPPHVHQSEDLHDRVGNGRGRSEVPISMRPASRGEALDWMYLPGGGPWEDVSNRNNTWVNFIVERVLTKLGRQYADGNEHQVILLTGRVYGEFGEAPAIQAAFSYIRRHRPEAKSWTFAICHQWNDLHYFSALDSPQIGFEIKSSSK